MENTQRKMIENIIVRKKEDCRTAMVAIYREIARKTMEQPVDRLAQTILLEESPAVNEYIRTLRNELKAEACKAMVDSGISESAASIAWANVMNKAGLPKASLCRREDVKVPSGTAAPSGPSRQEREEIRRLESTRNISMGVAAAGAAVTVITCLVVPGWSGIAFAAKAAKVTGVVVVGCGAAGAVISQQKIEEINRIANQAVPQGPTAEDIQKLVNQVCKHQCNENGRIIYEWLDAVCSELIRQCEIELQR